MSGLRFFTRASDGSLVLASYHPRHSLTWHWAVSVKRNALYSNRPRRINRAAERFNQWHDMYRLAFGWWLIVSRQDYHMDALP
jgi:hypothetical protein